MRKLLLASAAFLMACSAEAQKSDFGPPSEVQDIYTIATEASPDRILNDIQTLVDFGTRHTLSETESETRGIGAARRCVGYSQNLRKFLLTAADASKSFMCLTPLKASAASPTQQRLSASSPFNAAR